MRRKYHAGTIVGAVLLFLFAILIGIAGYRVVVTADEVPGKLGCVATAAKNQLYDVVTIEEVQKVSYETMKYGYMDDVLMAQMDALDQQYNGERLDEIRAINDLTAMSEKTSDKLAYEQAKKQLELEAERKKQAAARVEVAKQAYQKQLAQNNNSSTSSSKNTGGDSTKSNGGKKGKAVYTDSKGKSLGKFVITAYCSCRVCCGVYSGNNRTASGTVPTANRTIAVDTSVIPFNTKVIINGQVYVAEDRGSAIKGNRIDMFFMTHQEALNWGRRTMEVYLAD